MNMQKPEFGYYSSGNIRYETHRLNGKCHRIDGPAHITYYESGVIRSEEYYVDDKRHRIDGPAWIRYYGSGKIVSELYWINDKQIDINKFCKDYGCTFPFNEEDQLIFNLTYG